MPFRSFEDQDTFANAIKNAALADKLEAGQFTEYDDVNDLVPACSVAFGLAALGVSLELLEACDSNSISLHDSSVEQQTGLTHFELGKIIKINDRSGGSPNSFESQKRIHLVIQEIKVEAKRSIDSIVDSVVGALKMEGK